MWGVGCSGLGDSVGCCGLGGRASDFSLEGTGVPNHLLPF